MQFQRPRLAVQIAERGLPSIAPSLRRTVLFAAVAWLGNVVTIASILLLMPQRIYKDGYPSTLVDTALLILASSLLIKGIREPIGAALQASDNLRPLHVAAMCGAVVSVLTIAVGSKLADEVFPIALGSAVIGEFLILAFSLVSYLKARTET